MATTIIVPVICTVSELFISPIAFASQDYLFEAKQIEELYSLLMIRLRENKKVQEQSEGDDGVI